jgi:hypothetical protein
MLTFCTTCNPYYPKSWIYDSLSLLSCRTRALLDPDDARTLPANVQRINFRSDRFYQEGKFLDAMPDLRPNDVVILADADAIIQRDLSEGETEFFEAIGDAIAIGYNIRPGQDGETELGLLRPKFPLDWTASAFRVSVHSLTKAKVYNWGLVAAKVSTWLRLRALYDASTLGINPQDFFKNPTWLQYILCVLAHHHGISIVEIGYHLHSHQHFGFEQEHTIKDGKLRYKDREVFFVHNAMSFCG